MRMWLVALMMFYVNIAPIEAKAASHAKILLLNSYHAQYGWTAELTKGVQDTLIKQLPMENLHIEFMDERRFVDDDIYHQKLVDLYKYKYDANKPDIIITSDDAAFNFILSFSQQLFPDTPIVFSGVNTFDPIQITNKPWITGIVEGEAIMENLRLMAKIQPKLQHIIVLADSTGLGLNLFNKAIAIQKEWQKMAKYSHIKLDIRNSFDKHALAQEGKSLDQRTAAIFVLAIHHDISGEYFSYDKDIPYLSKNINAPIYGMWGSLLIDKGVIGGYMNNPYIHGVNAAKMALQILAGTNVSLVPIKIRAEYHPVFNYDQLQRFKINISSLPTDSEIIGLPISFYQTYSTEVNSVIATTIGLFIIIIMLIVNIVQRRQAQKTLKQFNFNLEQMVIDRTKELDERNIALENARKALENIAFTDSLTCLGNRRAGNEQMERFLKRLNFEYQPTAIALLDIDHFKKVNDTYGHLIGDEVLKKISEIIKHSIRPNDLAFRWGGEEFLIMLPLTEITTANQVCLRIKENISTLSLKNVGQVTVSIGLTRFSVGDSFDSLMQLVDDVLYKAKETGRNKIVVDSR